MQITFAMVIQEETTRMIKGFAYSNGNAPLLIETSRTASSTLNAWKIGRLFPLSSPWGARTTAKVASFVNYELWPIMWSFCDM
jgi:hypothetical protein